MSERRVYRVFLLQNGSLVAEGDAELCAAAIGYNGTKSFYSEVTKSDRGKSKYRIERVFPEAEQEAIRAWDTFCEPIRARYGIQVRKEDAK